MFLKQLERRKNGEQHTYWALVESYRTARGLRDRVVAHLANQRRLGGTAGFNWAAGWTRVIVLRRRCLIPRAARCRMTTLSWCESRGSA